MGEGAKAGRQGARGTTGDCRPAVQRPALSSQCPPRADIQLPGQKHGSPQGRARRGRGEGTWGRRGTSLPFLRICLLDLALQTQGQKRKESGEA